MSDPLPRPAHAAPISAAAPAPTARWPTMIGFTSRMRLLLLLGAVGVPLAWEWGEGGDAVVRVEVLRMWLALLVGASFFWLRTTWIDRVLERAAAWCECHALLVLGVLLAAVYAIAWATTPQIAFGRGAQGLGYGDDGLIYGAMTEHFAWFTNTARPPYNARPLAPFLVHSLGLPTFTGYRLLNSTSYALCGLLVYGIGRHFAGVRTTALLAVAFFAMIKFGLKFWLYDPVRPDALATLLLLAVIYATLRRSRLGYTAAMAAALYCRENYILLVGFNVLYELRMRTGLWSRLGAIALQAVPIGVYVLSQLAPPCPPSRPFDPRVWPVFNAITLVIFPYRPTRAAYAHVNSLGLLLVLPVLSWRASARFLRLQWEWKFYVVATLVLSLLGGLDADRFAVWQAPALLPMLALAAARWRGAWLWFHLVGLHAVVTELPLHWDPSKQFYMARYAAYAPGTAFGYLSGSCVLLMVLAAAMLRAHRSGDTAQALWSRA